MALCRAEERVLLFLHLPKTGGSTLSSCIYSQSGLPAQSRKRQQDERFFHKGIYHYPVGFFKDPPGPLPPGIASHLSRPDVRAVLGHFSFGLHRHLERPGSYVTMLRDPVERILSLFCHLRTTRVLKEEVDLRSFVRDCPPEGWNAELSSWHPGSAPACEARLREASRALVDNDQTRRIAGAEPGFGECGEDLLERARTNLARHFAVAGVTERFDETLLLVHRRFGLSGKPRYLPRLVNRKRLAVEELREADRAAVLERNALDAALHAFAEQLLEDKVREEGERFEEELAAFRKENARHVRTHRQAVREMGLT